MKTLDELKRIAEFNSLHGLTDTTVIYETEDENHKTFIGLPTQNSYRINIPPPLLDEVHGSIRLYSHNFHFIDLDKI